MRALCLSLLCTLLLIPAAPASAKAPRAQPLQATIAPLHITSGALLFTPPTPGAQSHLYVSLGTQLAATDVVGWAEYTAYRGNVTLGGEWAIKKVPGLALGGSLGVFEFFVERVYIPPAMDELEDDYALGTARLYLSFLLADSAGPRPKLTFSAKGLRTQIGLFLRGTFPTATSVLSDRRRPSIPLRGGLGDGVNSMGWGALELGGSLTLLAFDWWSTWISLTPLYVAILPDGEEHLNLMAVHLNTAVRLPWLVGRAALELILETAGFFRFPVGSVDGLATVMLTPGLRFRLERWDLSVGARFGLGHWVELSERYTVGVEWAYRFK